MKPAILAVVFLAVFAGAALAQSTMTGTISLGAPVDLSAGAYAVPVTIRASYDSPDPQSFCFRLRFSRPARDVRVDRSGATRGAQPVFEWQTGDAGGLSYVAVYDGRTSRLQAGVELIVAMVRVTIDGAEPLEISFDPSLLTMIGNQQGTVSATPPDGTLTTTGITITPAPAGEGPTSTAPTRRRASGGH